MATPTISPVATLTVATFTVREEFVVVLTNVCERTCGVPALTVIVMVDVVGDAPL